MRLTRRGRIARNVAVWAILVASCLLLWAGASVTLAAYISSPHVTTVTH